MTHFGTDEEDGRAGGGSPLTQEPPLDEVGATYAIGDVQGCFDDLLRLLDHIDFDPAVDRLWFTGDLVNRGPNSLGLLRFVRRLGHAAVCVLGNHDLHLLAAAAGALTFGKKDTLASILEAHDREELLFWLRHQPLLYHDERLGFAMVHAGLPPQWDLATAKARAAELETLLQNPAYGDLLHQLGPQEPWSWSEDLAGWDRLRYIANCFTQLRWCDAAGRLDLDGERRKHKGARRSQPWFQVPGRASQGVPILFGHWARLKREGLGRGGPDKMLVHALDTGCANGGQFTALRLEDGRYFRVRCRNEAVRWAEG
jgi:bis(5'-nucleosyl)-tetraphosphatase (symmetrical)